VGKSFLVAVCIKCRVIVFIIIASGIDIMVGKVLLKACNCFFKGFVRGVWWLRTEGKSQSK